MSKIEKKEDEMPSGNPPKKSDNKSNFKKVALLVAGATILGIILIIIFG